MELDAGAGLYCETGGAVQTEGLPVCGCWLDTSGWMKAGALVELQQNWSALLGDLLLKSSADQSGNIDAPKNKAQCAYSPGIVICKRPPMLTAPLRTGIISAYYRNKTRQRWTFSR